MLMSIRKVSRRKNMASKASKTTNDKTLDQVWEHYLKAFFKKHQIPFEELE